LQALGAVGAFRLSGVVMARVADVSVSSSYLFTLNVMFALSQYTETPFRSQTPSLGRGLASGSEQLAHSARGRSKVSLSLLAAALLGLGLAGPPLLKWGGAQTPLLAPELGLLMGLVFMVRGTYGLAFAICAVGNHIVCYYQQVAAGVISCAVILLYGRVGGVVAVLLALLLPQVLLLRMRPLGEAAAMLGVPRAVLIRDFLPPVLAYVLGAAVLGAVRFS
jgi:hypothetical protein